MKKEKKIEGNPEPAGIACTRKILDQMINCICKIKTKDGIGTGFFCKIPLGKDKTIDCLMTNYHVIDEKYFKENKEINLLLNDDQEIKTIDIKNKRIAFFNEAYDIAIIELKQKDGIKNFLEIDENLFMDKEYVFYFKKSIYILQYPKGKKAAVSYGLVNNFNINVKYDFRHSCSTDDGSSGSPVLNLENNKVIGIHKEGAINFNYNKGTILKYPLNDFKDQIKNIKNNTIIESNTSLNDKEKISNNQKNKQGDKNTKVVSPFIICPICKEHAKYEIKNFEIKIYGCKNNHITEDLLFKDFEKTQIIDESLIICNNCKKNNKSNTPNKEMYICKTCNINLCPLCKSNHNKNHIIINYDKKDFICDKHNQEYNSYCETCDKNICISCKSSHKEHDIIFLFDKTLEENLKIIIKEQKNKESILCMLKKILNIKIEMIMDKFNTVMKNIEQYFKIFQNNIENPFILKIFDNLEDEISQMDYFVENLQSISDSNVDKEFIPGILKMFNEMNKNDIELI